MFCQKYQASPPPLSSMVTPVHDDRSLATASTAPPQASSVHIPIREENDGSSTTHSHSQSVAATASAPQAAAYQWCQWQRPSRGRATTIAITSRSTSVVVSSLLAAAAHPHQLQLQPHDHSFQRPHQFQQCSPTTIITASNITVTSSGIATSIINITNDKDPSVSASITTSTGSPAQALPNPQYRTTSSPPLRSWPQ